MKRIFFSILLTISIFILSACGLLGMDLETEFDESISLSEFLEEFDNDRVSALEKYESGEEIYFKNIFISSDNDRSTLTLNESIEINSIFFNDFVYLSNEDNILDEYIYRVVDLKVIFVNYNEGNLGFSIEMEFVEIIEVKEIEFVFTLEQLNDLSQSEYYSMLGEIVNITGIFYEKGACSPSLTNEDQSINLRLSVLGNVCPDVSDGTIIEVFGFVEEMSHDVDKIYVLEILINED